MSIKVEDGLQLGKVLKTKRTWRVIEFISHVSLIFKAIPIKFFLVRFRHFRFWKSQEGLDIANSVRRILLSSRAIAAFRAFSSPTDFRPTFEAKLSAGKLGTMPKNNLSDYLEHNATFLTNHPLFVLLRALTTQFWYSIREVFNGRCCSFHSTTEIRWRGGEERVQWRTDRVENTKKHVKQSKIESINVPNPTVTFILVAVAVLFSLVAYIFFHWFSAE